MSQIATTIEQGNRLIEAYVDPKTADMKHTRLVVETDSDGYVSLFTKSVFHVEIGEARFEGEKPAWSLSALWDIIHQLDKTYEFPSSLSSEQLIENLVTRICYRREHQ